MSVSFNNVRSDSTIELVSNELKNIGQDIQYGAVAGFIASTITAGGIVALTGTVPGTVVIGLFNGITGTKTPEKKAVKLSAVVSSIVIGTILATTEGGIASAAFSIGKVLVGAVISGIAIGAIGNGVLKFAKRRLDFLPNGIEI